VIVCLCGDIFPTTEAMRLHLDMVHTQPKALDARQQHEPVNCGMSWDDAMGYQPKSSQPSSVSSIAEVKTRLNYVNEVLVGAEGTSADLHAVLDAQEAVRQVADRVEALEQEREKLKRECELMRGHYSLARARADAAEASSGALAKHCASLEADREYNAQLVRERDADLAAIAEQEAAKASDYNRVCAERDRLKESLRRALDVLKAIVEADACKSVAMIVDALPAARALLTSSDPVRDEK
jgi:hypothetical protein